MNEAIEFLKRTADCKHRIVSSGDLSELQIVEAQACGRFYVDPDTALGWALMPWELSTQKDRMREAGVWRDAGHHAVDD